MKKPMMCWIDQYDHKYWAKTIKELRKQVGGGGVSKMYVDGKDGKTYHCGYVIGKHWLSGYMPMMVEQ